MAAMTLDEAKVSAKEGIIQQMNEYVLEQLPTAALLHAVVLRLQMLATNSTPTSQTDATLLSILNFFVASQANAQPFFALIDAATTVEEVWQQQGAYNPQAVPAPAAKGLALYATKIESQVVP